MTPPVHTTIVQTEGPHEITVRPMADDGRWFRVLNWFYDNIVPELDGAQVKVMLGILRDRDNTTGLSRVTRSQMAAHLRLSRGTVTDAIKGLLALGLITDHGAAGLSAFPDRTFAGRFLDCSTNRTNALTCSPNRTFPPPEFDRSNTACIDRVRGDSIPKTNPPRPDRTIRLRPSTPAVQIGDDDDRVRMLCAGMAPRHRGFTPEAARSILASTGASTATVRDAIRNAAFKADRGDLRHWQGYVATQLRQGCALFETLQAIDDQVQRVEDRLRRLVAEFADQEQAAAVTRWFDAMPVRERARAISKASMALPDSQLWPRVMEALRAGRRA